MARTDTNVSKLIINQLSYDDFSGIENPSGTEFYLVEENDINVCETIRPNRKLISSYPLPSNESTELTLLESGSPYTVPENGYVCLCKEAEEIGQYIQIVNGYLKKSNYAVVQNQELDVYLPCIKGQTITINYNASGATISFRLIKCFGSTTQSSSVTDLEQIYNDLHTMGQ